MANFFHYLWLAFKFLLITVLVAIVALVIILLTTFKNWQAFAQSAYSGKQNLEQAISYLGDKELTLAQISAKAADINFQQSLNNLENIRYRNPLLKLKWAQNQLLDLERTVAVGQILSVTLDRGVGLFKEAEDLNLQKESGDDLVLNQAQSAKIITWLFELEPELIGIKANLDLALYNLENIGQNGILWPIKDQLTTVKEKVAEAHLIADRALPILRLLPVLGGWPEESRFLVLFQNNDELRPTGGFLGSYATIRIANLGNQLEMKTDDTYHLDMPSIPYLETVPPDPISKYMSVKKWYLRDANWSPDWPQSAIFIEDLFYQESRYANQEFPDLTGIIAVTPDLVANLISLTGPINLDGELYTADNLQKLLQYQTGVAYIEENISSWDRKNIINDLATIIKDKLKSLPATKLPDLIAILDQAIKRKDVLMYFTSPQAQALAINLQADGAIKKPISDYLMVVDANLAAFKTDAVVEKTWSYQVDDQGENLLAKLTLNYNHQGGFDWRTTRYRSYTRVLTPLGSRLISLQGLIQSQADLTVLDDQALEKTIFGFFLSVEPGTSKTITLTYQLPADLQTNIKNDQEYQLSLQRQPGSRIKAFNFAFNTSDQIIPTEINNFFLSNNQQQALLTSDLENDKLIRIFLK